MLEAKGRVRLDRPVSEWLHQVLELPGLELLPLSPGVAVRSARLPPGFHGDPADRLIVATALVEFAPLVTADEKLHRLPGLETVWD